MDNVVVTLRYQNREADVDLPADLPVAFLGPILIESLEWPEPVTNSEAMATVAFQMRAVDSGIVVRPAETLASAGIVNGEILELMLVHQAENTPSGDEAPPVATPGTPYLQCTVTGRVFPCSGSYTMVGRGRRCNADLSKLPASDVVSRQHANIVRQRGSFRIRDLRSTNGTIVDGYVLRVGETVLLRDQSHIRFGEEGPLLIFHAGH